MNITQTQPRLTVDQVKAYHRDGYLLPGVPVLPEEKFAGLKASFELVLSRISSDDRPESMDVPHLMHPELFEWAFNEDLLDLVTPILGPDLVLFSTHFICKPKGNGRRVPWHEDSHYWRDMVTPMEVVTVWLALDPSTRENGCMMVIPRSHQSPQQGYSDYGPVDSAQNVFGSEIVESQRDDQRRIYIELAPNHCSLHDARIQHGSEANTSSKRRCGWTLRFTSSAVKFGDFHGAHQVYLARGRDRGGNTYADPTRSYPKIMAKRGNATRYKNSH